MLETGYEHQHLFTKVFENAPIGMALISPNGRFMKVNQSLCKMLGYSEAELTGLTFQLITYQDDLEENMDLRQKTISAEIDSYRIEKRYVHKSGKLIWGLLNATVERDTRGNLNFYISQIVDITKQKIREEKIRFMDQGCGIPQDQLAKIGSPFYTTKEQGTGLGIMVSHRIIQNHKGTMRIESEVGKGSTVEIILPIS